MKAVVFDLDGVVVDTEKYWSREERDIYDKAIKSGEVDIEELSGMSIDNTYQHLEENYDIAVSRDEFFDMYERRAEKVYMEKADLMDGFRRIVDELRDMDVRIGLATGSYWPQYVIKRFDLEFDAVVDSSMADGKGKPEPETYRLAVERLGVEPEEAVAVDDTGPGTSSASAAGLYCIGYPDSEDAELEEADEVVLTPERLESRLLEILG